MSMLPSAAASEISPGAVLVDRFRVDALLGEGGMGVVWAATEIATARRAAIKVLRREAWDRPDARRRLSREAEAQGALQHPNIVAVREVIELSDGAPALVMELLDGEALSAKIEREGPLSIGEAAAIFVPLVSAVGAAHAKGIVHRDLKPENVLLARGRAGEITVKVLDFGVARLTIADPDSAPSARTTTGALVGTPCFMAPEQAAGEREIDHRVDIWAIGLMLYQALSGVLPTAGENLGQVWRAIQSRPFWPLAEAAPDTPADVASLVDRMLSRPRSGRPSDLREALSVLSRYTDVRAPDLGAPSVPVAREEPPAAGPNMPVTAGRNMPVTAGPNKPVAPARISVSRARRGVFWVLGGIAIVGISLGIALGGRSLGVVWGARDKGARGAPRLRAFTSDGDASGAEVSPDGQLVAITRPSGLHLRRADGSFVGTLDAKTDGLECAAPVWLPDGGSVWLDPTSAARTLQNTPGRRFNDLVAFSRDGARRAQWLQTRHARIYEGDPEIPRAVRLPVGVRFLRRLEPAPRDGRALLLGAGDLDSLWVVGEDGEPRLVAQGGSIAEARWSPAGDALVALRSERGAMLDLVRFPLDGGAPEVLVAEIAASAACVSLSIDGGGRVYLTRSERRRRVFVLERSDGGVTARPALGGSVAREALSVSPGGDVIVYSESGPQQHRLMVAPLSGGEPALVAYSDGLEVTGTAFAPDGARFAWIELRADGAHRIRLAGARPKGGEERSFAVNVGAGTGFLGWLDDRRIAYLNREHDAIDVLDVTTGQSKGLFAPHNGWVNRPRMSRDRSKIAFAWNPREPHDDVVVGAFVLHVETGVLEHLPDSLLRMPFGWTFDGRLLTVGRDDRRDVRVHDPGETRPFEGLPKEGAPEDIVPLPGGELLTMSEDRGDVWVVEGVESALAETR